MSPNVVSFNVPYMTGSELDYIGDAHRRGHLAGDGHYTRLCHQWLEREVQTERALLTHSCTAALELSAILANIGPGDEVIMPSYTFVSTANAFALRGATPVFVDVRPDTLNLDERLIEDAITSRTRAIVPVHYAGVACEMDAINDIAARHDLVVIEDAAQAIQSTYRGRPLGTLGDLGTLSFHETKNVICGEGGALLVNRPELAERAEIIREKGTDRSKFFRGEVDKYTWVDVGSSFLPGELLAAFLYAQLEQAEAITAARLRLWRRYHEALEPLEVDGLLSRPTVPAHCEHNAHMYYVLTPTAAGRTELIKNLADVGIHAVFHYVPLHSSPQGQAIGRSAGELSVTDDIASRIVRLPLWVGLERQQALVVSEVTQALRGAARRRSPLILPASSVTTPTA
jgi:dTDP-4-amino-4,6-dideoxygalactose transaminase